MASKCSHSDCRLTCSSLVTPTPPVYLLCPRQPGTRGQKHKHGACPGGVPGPQRVLSSPVLRVPALLALHALGTCREDGIDEATGSQAQVVLSLCVSLSQLNLSRPIEEQGPLDVIIHKLTDVILEADQNDSQALELVHRFQVRGGGGQGGGEWWLGTALCLSEAVELSCWVTVDTALPLPRCGHVVGAFPARVSVFGGEMGPLVATPVCRLPLEI